MKNFSIYFFSPTGGTKRVADIFEKALGDAVVTGGCDITVDSWESSFGPDDTVMFFFPVYGGRVPGPLYERLGKLHGSNTRAIPVAVFGNRAVDDALLEMSDILKKQGFYTAAAAEVVARHSINPKVAEGRPDELDIRKINSFARQLLESDGDKEVAVPGKRPYVKYNGLPLNPSSGPKCTKCLICYDNCPARAIPGDHPNRVDRSKCISCMRCINLCTMDIRSVPAPLLATAKATVKAMCSERKNPKFYI